ncbi:hypothetical protein [Methylobacterium sp. J-077]|uniref:hypothetical protein n=1 Tax=Methylobacterium sp. J-077 TaxID=2836656 RepID=UPI001FB8DE6D|nr:hypothetical protein [Methylobacterium sp. J-077]MCJ2127144.1 hypothetical protein [Methylobacterium sp. J-077]
MRTAPMDSRVILSCAEAAGIPSGADPNPVRRMQGRANIILLYGMSFLLLGFRSLARPGKVPSIGLE